MATTKTELLNNGVVVATKLAAPFYSWDWVPTTEELAAAVLTYKRYEDGGATPVFTSGVVNGTVEAVGIPAYTPEAETTSYMNQISIVNDATVYNQDSLEQIKGEEHWYYFDKFVKQGKADGWYATGKVFLSERGNTLAQQRINALLPASTNYPLYNNGWTHNGAASLPKSNTSYIELPYTYGALGVAANNLTIAAVELSNGKAFGTNDRYLFGNVDSGTIRVNFVSARNKAISGLTKDSITYTHNNLDSAGSIVATIQSNNTQRTYKKGVKIGETVTQNATALPTANIKLHSLNLLADYYSPQSASLYWIGTGLTEAQAISLSNALDQYAIDLNITNDLVPKPVMYKSETVGGTSGGSIYWRQWFKSSDYPEFTTTKPYFCVYSTDHDSNIGGIYWGEADDLDSNGFIEGGLIWSGTQSETPWLYRKTGGTDAEFQLYISQTGIPQVTRLLTSNGGAAMHLSTWTDRGTVHPIEPATDDNHVGYSRVYDRGTDLICTHLGSTSPVIRQWVSVSTNNGYSFTKLAEFDGALNMPAGRVYVQETMIPFTRNATLYAIAFTNNTDGTNSRLSIITLGTDYRCSGFVRNITGELPYDVMNGYEEGNFMHLEVKNGNTPTDRPNPYFKMKFDLTTV